MFDLTLPQTMDAINEWHDRICEVNDGRVITVLVGNKSDLPGRKVTAEQGEKLAESIGAIYRETSALTGKGVTEVFEDACEEYLKFNPTSSRLRTKQSVDVAKPDAPKGNCSC